MRWINKHVRWAAAVSLAASTALMGQPGPRNDRVPVIIGFNRHPGASEQALVRAFGGAVKHTYWIIPAIAAELPPQAVAALENHPAVSVIEPDVQVYAIGEYDNAWGVAKIGAKAVHDSGNGGQGRNVCVIDTGIDISHPDLSSNYARGWNFVNNSSNPSDDNGHGTHVAGTIAAVFNGSGVIGVAPQAQIYAYKILDANGSGSFSNAIAAVQRCITEAGVGSITNNSYGSSVDPGTQVKAAFDNAYNSGVLHVAAAGNATLFTCNQVSYPAKYDSVIAVGATDANDVIASWSCRGPEVELSAPGVGIYSTWLNDGYATASGTSMASPHVAGTAALVFAGAPVDQNGDGKIDNVDVRLCLQRTALDLGSVGRDTAYGSGRVRAYDATTACKTPPPPETPPTAPSNLTVTSVGRNYVKLRWTDNSTNETNFEVERCTGSICTDFAKIATLSANTTTYNNSGLARRTTYSYRVRAINNTGLSAYSDKASATTR